MRWSRSVSLRKGKEQKRLKRPNSCLDPVWGINYSGAPSYTFPQTTFSDWADNSAGNSVAARMSYCNAKVSGGNGRDVRMMYLYAFQYALDPTKAVFSSTLPSNSRIQILAMNLVYGTTQGSPARSAGLIGPAGDTGTTPSNLDGNNGRNDGEEDGLLQPGRLPVRPELGVPARFQPDARLAQKSLKVNDADW
ncbi:MAG: hypothetical protein ACP5XB_29855 [Isosphaeraceae bacterium]